jgi:hypothetical protein
MEVKTEAGSGTGEWTGLHSVGEGERISAHKKNTALGESDSLEVRSFSSAFPQES